MRYEHWIWDLDLWLIYYQAKIKYINISIAEFYFINE